MDIRGETRARLHAGQRQVTASDRAARARTGRRRERRDYRTRPTVSVVIPTLNEAKNLPHVFDRLPNGVNELIVVDGRSTDHTVEVAQELRPDARIVLQDRRGKGNALACGFAAARGDIIVTVDADGSTDPGEIPGFIAPLIAGADFVKGSRYMRDGGSADLTRVRSVGNRALGASVNVLFGTHYTDLCYGYNAFWRRCLPKLHVNCDGFEVETVINVRAAKAGLAVVEVPSYEHDRIHGLSNLSAWRDGRRVLKAILQERFTRLPEPSDAWMPQYAEVSGLLRENPTLALPAGVSGSNGEQNRRVPSAEPAIARAMV
jgi:glycosyltransferase involved in cell wall biosynthesis